MESYSWPAMSVPSPSVELVMSMSVKKEIKSALNARPDSSVSKDVQESMGMKKKMALMIWKTSSISMEGIATDTICSTMVVLEDLNLCVTMIPICLTTFIILCPNSLSLLMVKWYLALLPVLS